jgi:hypothetical protein
MGVRKNNNNKKNATMLFSVVCLVMEEDQPIVMHILENKYGGNVILKGLLNSFSENQTQRSQKNVW